MARTRLLLVGNSRSILSLELVWAAIETARVRTDVEVVGVCDTAPAGPAGLGTVVDEALAAIIKRAFGEPPSLRRAALLRRGLPGVVIRPPGGDPNAATFLELIETSLRPDASIWLGGVRIAGAPLLHRLPRSVNYHNGTLPGIRGLRATAWSIYGELPTTGFSFHLMDEQIDTGPVIVAGELPVPPAATTFELEAVKTSAAIAALPRVLDAVVRGNEGTPQKGASAYFGQRDYHEVTTITDSSTVTWSDLDRRLRAFGRVWVTLPAGTLEVTRARNLNGRGRRTSVSFVTADGVAAEAVRFRFLPLPLYRTARRVDELRSVWRVRRGSG